MRPWEARVGTPEEAFLTYTTSAVEDELLATWDMAATIAHVLGLHGAGLVDREEATSLVKGVQGLHQGLTEGTWAPAPEDEDVHMAMESALADLHGGAKLHTGRSRNDEVATALVLWARAQAHHLAGQCIELGQGLTNLAFEAKAVPVQAETHHRPAAAVTVGHILAGHAATVQGHVTAFLSLVNGAPPCPLGGGALAGSGLPLTPEVPARLLGLEPVLNSLQAVGDRSYAHRVLAEAALLAGSLARLSTDLIRLSGKDVDGVHLPSAWCSGSSLMPHKLNPDTLELTRARAATVQAHLQAGLAMSNGAPLTYVRDLQEAKKHVLEGVTLAGQMAGALTAVVKGSSPGEGSATDPTTTALDLVEDAVLEGEAFRTAYTNMAGEVATRTEWTEPRLRATPGGPHPDRVAEAVGKLQAGLHQAAQQLKASNALAPLDLLQADAGELVDASVEVSP